MGPGEHVSVSFGSVPILGPIELLPVYTHHRRDLQHVAYGGRGEGLPYARRHRVPAPRLGLHGHGEAVVFKRGLLGIGTGRALSVPLLLPFLALVLHRLELRQQCHPSRSFVVSRVYAGRPHPRRPVLLLLWRECPCIRETRFCAIYVIHRSIAHWPVLVRGEGYEYDRSFELNLEAELSWPEYTLLTFVPVAHDRLAAVRVAGGRSIVLLQHLRDCPQERNERDSQGHNAEDEVGIWAAPIPAPAGRGRVVARG